MKNRYLNSKGSLFFCLAVLSCILSFQSVHAQEKTTITGTVISAEDQMMIPGVSIMEKGTSNGTSTDFDGNYTITVAPGATLEFSYIGFISQSIAIDGKTKIDVSLQTDTQQLDEVIVVGYGVQKKELVTGANQQITGESIAKQNTLNAMQALQGQTAGAQISSTSGQPGEAMKVIIRGVGTIGDATPLYIVDGVQTGDISYLNSSDIESISVLKDAASAAIYGSQAANGVILVTTKSGKKGKARITFDSYYGIQTLAKEIDLLNAKEYMTILNEAYINSGQTLAMSQEEVDQLGEGTNWLDHMIDTAIMSNYSLGISGGSETSSYSSSLSYLSQEGIVSGGDLSNYDRYNFRFNSDHKLLDGRVKFGENLSFAWINKQGISVGNQYSNGLRSAFNTSPMVPFYDANGNYYNTISDSDPWIAGMANPYAYMVYTNQNHNDNQRLLGNVWAEIEIIDNLKYRTSLGLDYNSFSSRTLTPIYSLSTYAYNNQSTVTQSEGKRYSTLIDNLLTYTFDIDDKHNFETMVGTSYYHYNGSSAYGKNVDLIYDDLEHAWLDNATNTDGALMDIQGSPENENKRLSYFGRLNYNFDGKYMFSATFRADESSQFAEGNRWGYFPSVSAGWIITRENFMTSSDNWLDYLKIRASWGQVGNQNAGAFQYLTPVTYSNTNYIFGEDEGVLTPGAYPLRLANPLIKWETSEQLDFGFDARLLNNKLNVAFDWYQKTTKDWLILPSVLATAGANPAWENGGNVKNTGVELSLTYRDFIGDDFSYSVSLNGAYNKNTVNSINTDDGIIHGETGRLWDNSPEFNRVENGHPVGYFWGYQVAGVFQNQDEVDAYGAQPDAEPGDFKYVDLNGDGTIDENDKSQIGNPNPDVTYGFAISLEYKGFDFFVQTNGVLGNQIVQSYRNQANVYNNNTTQILDRWHGEGTSNSIAKVTTDNRNYTEFSDFYVKDGDFLRISTVTLGYDLSRLFKKDNFFADKIRIYGSVQNLFTFTKYTGMDPEVGFTDASDVDGDGYSDYGFSTGVDVGFYPRPRTYMLGLNVSF
ncbi:SusC/RagA family TonB-linked outer membrane protein [Neptunitalea chrysea]|uniref:SusC/RagA family TonB-linked outer membrane protein n=1 Tax=Neptunitalea chrysea TaxID=1647581 RepID=A0A9W6EUP0_9FLAO|nr:TonB-dependent receptor [Neptunitalea chrysea]GLB51966.1 SusC/RagA family TonB-linked outer membrane protein [Neptunitalea chrysea]